MMRIGLFLLTNIAVLLLASLTLNLLGFDSIMAQNGVDLNLQALLVFCAVFGMAGSLISLFLSKWMAQRATGTRLITQPRTREEQWLLNTVQQLAQQAGIKTPDVGVFPSPVSNAFATGWNRNAALVAVSEGLLTRFREDELRAVLAHEIGHVANGDMVTLALIQGVINTFVMFFARIIGHTVDRVVFRTERGLGIGYYVVTFLSEIVLGLLASMIVMWFSRRREFRADAGGAALAGRDKMIAALQRLKQAHIPSQLPDQIKAFGINGGDGWGIKRLFMSHPPLEERIEVLRAQR